MEDVVYISQVITPIGFLTIKATTSGLQHIDFSDEKSAENENSFTLEAKRQLEEYFLRQRKAFDLPLQLHGTDFQQRVWNELQHIEYGKQISYLDMAIRLGDAKCIRAAGTANGKNPFAIVIPCHRVVGKNGSLVGYAGGLHRKKWLLDFEQKVKTLF